VYAFAAASASVFSTNNTALLHARKMSDRPSPPSKSSSDYHPPSNGDTSGGGDDTTTLQTNDQSAQTASEPPLNSLTEKETIDLWKKQIYLQYANAGYAATIEVGEFLHILATGNTDRTNSWLKDDQINIPLALAVHNSGREDILVIHTSPGSLLASMGLGRNPPENFATAYPDILALMKQGTFRWIVVPCNDAMVAQTEAEKAAEESQVQPATTSPVEEEIEMDVPTKNDKAKAKGSKASTVKRDQQSKWGTSGAQGMHWGLMVIDTTTNEASWFDGALTIGRKNNKRYIEFMWPAGWVAGKVLCGYDQVMKRHPGCFTASTLKHVPHDHDDNNYKGDRGCACGPWLFAIFQYVLDHPEFLTNDHGLKGSFTAAKKAKRVREMAFDSLTTRIAMQQMIKRQFDKQEPDAIPYRLTPRIMKILDEPSCSNLLTGLNSLLPKDQGSDEDSEDHSNDDGNEDYRAAPLDDLLSLIENDPEEYAGLTKKQQLRLAFRTWLAFQQSELEGSEKPTNILTALKNHEFIVINLPVEQVREFVEKEPVGKSLTMDDGEWRQRTVLQKVYGRLDSLTKEQTALWKKRDPRMKEFKLASHKKIIACLKKDVADIPEPNIRGNPLYYPDSYINALFKGLKTGPPVPTKPTSHGSTKDTYDSDLGKRWPEGTTSLPNFALISDDELKKWKASNPDLFTTPKPGHNSMTDRALLHIRFQRSFEKVSKEDLSKHWIKDGAVFDSFDEILTPNQLREKLMHHYEADRLKRAAIAAGHEKKRKAEVKQGLFVNLGNKRKAGDEKQQTAGDTKRAKTDYVVPRDPNEIDWCRIPDAQLKKFLTKGVLENERIDAVEDGERSWAHRAILFVQHGGHFTDESDERMRNYWSHDRNVFTYGTRAGEGVDIVRSGDGSRQALLTIEDMKKRMRDKYETVEVSDGSSEEE
jgi:hypothetical protein